MIFIYGGTPYEINNYDYGINTTINLNMKKIVSSDNVVTWYDYGKAYDYRSTQMFWKLNSSECYTMNRLLNKFQFARLSTISLQLNSNDWLYPFGPDLGNSGTFTMDCVDSRPSALLSNPWRYFDFYAGFNMVSNPTYSIPLDNSQGDIQIGIVEGLSYPTIDLKTQRNQIVNINTNGTVNKYDNLEKYDFNIASFSFTLRSAKAGSLIYYLVEIARGESFQITTNSNNYLFGVEGGDSGIYTVKLYNNTISVTHKTPSQFTVSFSVIREQI